MLFASYDPTVYPNPRFMEWQEQPPWHVFCTSLQPGGASPVLLTGHELNVFCNEQPEWGVSSTCFAGCRCLGRRGRDSTAGFGRSAASSRSPTTIHSSNNPTPRLTSPST